MERVENMRPLTAVIVWSDKPQVTHHRRDDDGLIETQIVTTGQISLDPPGITVSSGRCCFAPDTFLDDRQGLRFRDRT